MEREARNPVRGCFYEICDCICDCIAAKCSGVPVYVCCVSPSVRPGLRQVTTPLPPDRAGAGTNGVAA